MAGTGVRYRLLLDQTCLTRKHDAPRRREEVKELAPDAVLGILSPFGDNEDFIFTQLGRFLYYDGDDCESITENNADDCDWEKTGFPVVIEFDKGVSGEIWLVFNFWPEDCALDRHAHENLAAGIGGELPGVEGRFTMAKIADHISELGHDSIFGTNETSTSMNVANPRETFRVSETSPLICKFETRQPKMTVMQDA